MNLLRQFTVAIARGPSTYPAEAPFHPPQIWPELRGIVKATSPSNGVYTAVRDCLRLLALDDAHFGTAEWNPLGDIIRPGDRVIIKPNLVAHVNSGRGPLEAVVTHGSVIRAVADYVLLALKGRGSLTIGDAPQMNCDFEALGNGIGLSHVSEYFKGQCAGTGVKFSVRDFRRERTKYRYGMVWERIGLPAAPNVSVDLASSSYMNGIEEKRLYGADYTRSVTVKAHSHQRHVYVVDREVLESDVVISLPKLKVHSKVGTTLNIKNMVGINSDKNHLAHYRIGPPSKGGDEMESASGLELADRWLSDHILGVNWRFGKYPFLVWRTLLWAFRRVWPAKARFSPGYGNWHGNDTAWRMALDLNRIVLFAKPDGSLNETPVRRYFSIIDGIVGGQGDGPLHPDAYPSGVIVAGTNPLATDWVATTLMGFDPNRIRMYSNGVHQAMEWWPEFNLTSLDVRADDESLANVLKRGSPFHFAPAPAWVGTVERDGTTVAATATGAFDPPDPIAQ